MVDKARIIDEIAATGRHRVPFQDASAIAIDDEDIGHGRKHLQSCRYDVAQLVKPAEAIELQPMGDPDDAYVRTAERIFGMLRQGASEVRGILTSVRQVFGAQGHQVDAVADEKRHADQKDKRGGGKIKRPATERLPLHAM